MITKIKDRALAIGLQQLQSQQYEHANHTRTMKTQKEMYKLKKELMEKLTGDIPYYGLSLESLVNNQ